MNLHTNEQLQCGIERLRKRINPPDEIAEIRELIHGVLQVLESLTRSITHMNEINVKTKIEPEYYI
jgi:hypothetical protein